MVIAGAITVLNLGQGPVAGTGGTPAPQSSGVLDAAAVSADMRKLAEDGNDIATLQDLANLYHAAKDYGTAQGWLQKILEIDPKNTTALLAYGAAAFNLGDLPTAEAKWRAVLALDPSDVEAHYDLAFVYINSIPPNTDAARMHWNAVLALNPSTELRGFVETQLTSLGRLESAQPATSEGPASAAPSSRTAPASQVPTGATAAPSQG